ncbi:MAG: choloylglycine hydrolase [Anaerovoracaceae bacterium]|jgi:choloylglycine hydrolase
MCTFLVLRKKDAYAGRNLDLDSGFNEKIVITPGNYKFPLKNGSTYLTKHAMIGMASVAGNYPLYAEAVNEKGLAMAGLNFPGNAVYFPEDRTKDNITPFELIPWILGQTATVREAEEKIRRLNLLNKPFAENMPLAPLHFMITDAEKSIVAESTADGLRIYGNPYDVLTNNPPFPFHEYNLRGFRHLSARNGEAAFAGQNQNYSLDTYAEGMGAMGLPGDLSSASRFVRAAFTLANSSCGETDEACIAQTFHILDSVAMTEGSVVTAQGTKDITRYSCCMNLRTADYYYKTYWNNQITKISLREGAAASDELTVFPLRVNQSIFEEN